MTHIHACSTCNRPLTCCCEDREQSVLCLVCFRAKLIDMAIEKFRLMVEEVRRKRVA